jgi:hypothetical protein
MGAVEVGHFPSVIAKVGKLGVEDRRNRAITDIAAIGKNSFRFRPRQSNSAFTGIAGILWQL